MMYLDTSKKPGDPDAVKTSEDILAENARLKEEYARLRSGNAAAMREMLRRIDRLCRVTDDEAGTAWNMDIAHRVRDEIQAALDMPARNCDRTFADHVAMYDEFKAWCNAKGHTMNPKLASDAFDWLLSKAEGAE